MERRHPRKGMLAPKNLVVGALEAVRGLVGGAAGLLFGQRHVVATTAACFVLVLAIVIVIYFITIFLVLAVGCARRRSRGCGGHLAGRGGGAGFSGHKVAGGRKWGVDRVERPHAPVPLAAAAAASLGSPGSGGRNIEGPVKGRRGRGA